MPFKSEKQRRYLFKYKPKLAKEWHPEKNNELTPQTVTPNKNIKKIFIFISYLLIGFPSSILIISADWLNI